MYQGELAQKIEFWRQKAREGTLTVEEQREAILALRQDRKGAAVVSEQARKKRATATVKSAADLLGELDGL